MIFLKEFSPSNVSLRGCKKAGLLFLVLLGALLGFAFLDSFLFAYNLILKVSQPSNFFPPALQDYVKGICGISCVSSGVATIVLTAKRIYLKIAILTGIVMAVSGAGIMSSLFLTVALFNGPFHPALALGLPIVGSGALLSGLARTRDARKKI